MSRSYKKTKIFGNVGGSEKEDKRIYNRRYRRNIKTQIDSNIDPEAEEFLILKEVSNPWSMSKDGKRYWNNAKDEDMRK